MPLSGRDQHLLDQIEQDFRAEDPKLAAALGPASARSGARRSMMRAVAGVLLGMTLVLAGLAAKIIVLSVLGFLIIVAAVAYATTKLSILGPPGRQPLLHGPPSHPLAP